MKRGDIVRLKSGGVEMTYMYPQIKWKRPCFSLALPPAGYLGAGVMWIDNYGELQRDEIPEDLLEFVR